MVHRQFGHQLLELARMAQQAQGWCFQHRCQKRMRRQFGNAVGQAYGQARDLVAGRLANFVRDKPPPLITVTKPALVQFDALRFGPLVDVHWHGV